jgi:hypothetical protein
MTCIITGCTLRIGNKHVGGDLHQIGSAYVFNAILDGSSGANWLYDEPAFCTKEIDATECLQFFERRGVIIFDDRAVLNDEALAYLAKASLSVAGLLTRRSCSEAAGALVRLERELDRLQRDNRRLEAQAACMRDIAQAAAASFDDLQKTLTLLGRPTTAAACVIARDATRDAIAVADLLRTPPPSSPPPPPPATNEGSA